MAFQIVDFCTLATVPETFVEQAGVLENHVESIIANRFPQLGFQNNPTSFWIRIAVLYAKSMRSL